MLTVTVSTNTKRFPSITVDRSEATPHSVVAENPDVAGLPGSWSLDGNRLDEEQMNKSFEELFSELEIDGETAACFLSNVPNGKNA